jgi:polar amino acid transport system substrate-binding protein
VRQPRGKAGFASGLGWLSALLLVVLSVTAVAGVSAVAGAGHARQEAPLRVGVTHRPPLAIRYEDGWDGIAVVLWQRVAGDLGLDYEWVELREDEDLGALPAGLVDVVITADVTASAEADLDFSHSYFSSTLGFVQSSERQVVATIRGIFSPGFLRTAGWLTLVLLVVGVLTWLFERRHNPEDFGGGVLRGLWSGFWFAAVTLTAVGYGDKTPKTVAGRIVALVWMIVGLGVVATLTATIISVVALRTQATFSFPEDLRGATVGTVGGSRSASYLGDEQIAFEPYASTEDGLRAVNSGEIQYFVHDAAALRYFSSKLFDGRLAVVSAGARPQRYAFALDEGSELREPINRALLQHINSGSWPDLFARYQASATP